MASNDIPDYKKLFLEAEKQRKQEEERWKQAEERWKQAEERRKQAEERRKQAEERRKQAEEQHKQEKERREQEEKRWKQAEEQNRPMTFGELIRYGHKIVARSLRVANQSHCTSGKISAPIGKKCPVKLHLWTECQYQQEEIYHSVCTHLGSTGDTARRTFPPLVVLEYEGQNVKEGLISSEWDLESYEQSVVENHVQNIIAELCKIPTARDEFCLGDGVQFNSHANSLDLQTNQPSRSRSSRPDQYCIHRIDDGTSALLTTVEYKPPHKLPVESLHRGLKSMDFWEQVVKAHSVPNTEDEKAERIVGSVITQEYHVMIQEGLEYSYVTNGLALILLRVPYDDPGTLYYHLCEPNLEVNSEDDQSFLQPATAIARVLCLCLMSFRSCLRSQQWRNEAEAQLPTWKSSFDDTQSPVSEAESLRNTLNSKDPYSSPKSTTSEYQPPSSSSVESPTVKGRRAPTQSQPGCSPSTTTYYNESSDPDLDFEASGQKGQKHGLSEISSSPVQRTVRWAGSQHTSQSDGRHRQHDADFCTQRCLLGLQLGGQLDDDCLNVLLHKQSEDSRLHAIDLTTLVRYVKKQLDKNIDRNCTPMGSCGASGAPFKVTCAAYGYTVVGKGTTSCRWPELLREAEVYRVLQQAQGSAVPVFLGAIDLKKTYFLHGAGAIRHMLLMGWGGKPISSIENMPSCPEFNGEELNREISRSVKKIRSLGVLHEDLQLDNILWNTELRRALIIDFHWAKLDRRPKRKRMPLCGAETRPLK
ncbi:uncharacterized protein ASPGLDRAFT_52756 [Aspergillus glaucus CBS 516.65]|uniref:Protein kinase domain-containing protein n=1 Tax=Aspergillus glaucus CBS 516.65 TaxID=1160497 RepID=A0A1L9V5U3_ASPGL|nr:hypothetical protein ASPGLDRAFT_52756 [Aspergillus glaucus CBS 516.65]OJJ79294.1 hypothetical protein ASPGLDRAFT_52756 [Aspergillus glaucus CBS 516.65]